MLRCGFFLYLLKLVESRKGGVITTSNSTTAKGKMANRKDKKMGKGIDF